MSEMITKRESEIHFSSADHDKNIGWVRAGEVHDGRAVAIDVVTAAVINQEGAEFGYTHWESADSDHTSLPVPYQKGFGRVAAFSAILGKERNWEYEFNLTYVPQDMHYAGIRSADADDLLANGTGDGRRYLDAVKKEWAQSPTELLETLQTALMCLGFEDSYEIMYYWINGAVGREYPRQSALTHVERADLLLPDAKMAARTHSQLLHMKGIQQALSKSLFNDTNMRHRLSGFIADVVDGDMPDRFTTSREQAARYEREAFEEVSQLVVRRLAYVPPGNGRSARTWPYMDAFEPDANAAYGQELSAIRDGNPDRAIYELDREIKELEARNELAQEAIRQFELLNQLEQA